jgi:hypothetical protein
MAGKTSSAGRKASFAAYKASGRRDANSRRKAAKHARAVAAKANNPCLTHGLARAQRRAKMVFKARVAA